MFGLRLGEGEDFLNQRREVSRNEPKLHRASEVEKGFHHPIEPSDFRREDFELGRHALGIGGEFGFQNLHLKDHGVQRILHLVGHTRGQAADGGEPRRHVELVFELGELRRVA